MQFLKRHKLNRAIAMTEYLIILAIVAIAAIAIVGLFGKQIREVFNRTTTSLGGGDSTAQGSTKIGNDAKGEAAKTKKMKEFDAEANK